jgi:CHAT domain-containing protein
VIGTLWEVESKVAEASFTNFYAELRRGIDPCDAFAKAQRFMCAEHPQYRDWGAVQYIGVPI